MSVGVFVRNQKSEISMGTLTRIAFVFFLIECLVPLSQQQRHDDLQQGSVPDYLQFVFNATELSPSDDQAYYYDYIIVGGGTSGCPLASTLSQKHKTLLLERGGQPLDFPNLWTQQGFLPTLTTDLDATHSPAQPFTSEDGVPNARGRVLGGGSSINAGFYSRAHQSFFTKNASGFHWNLALVNRSYEWVERSVVFRPLLRKWQTSVRDALLQANVTPYNGYNLHHLLGTKIGGSTFDAFGRRHTAADLLTLATPSNLRVALHATAERILFDTPHYYYPTAKKPVAVGVAYRDSLGRHHHAFVRGKGEVILCAGALGSPQLLLLSGIGSRPYLSSWGIPVVHHLPDVGNYLYDNPRSGVSILSPIPLERSLIQVVGITDEGTFIEAASDTLPFTTPPRDPFRPRGSSSLYLTVASIMEKIAGPLSYGALRLASTDVRVNPLVRFNYFSNPEDLARCVRGMRKIGHVLRGKAMEEFKFLELFGRRDFRYVGPVLPFNQSDDSLMGDFCRRTVSTIWHYHGGCVVGKVVDNAHRVIGVDNLRVIDGSNLAVSPGTNPQATMMMLGRYMGRRITDERMRNG